MTKVVKWGVAKYGFCWLMEVDIWIVWSRGEGGLPPPYFADVIRKQPLVQNFGIVNQLEFMIISNIWTIQKMLCLQNIWFWNHFWHNNVKFKIWHQTNFSGTKTLNFVKSPQSPKYLNSFRLIYLDFMA